MPMPSPKYRSAGSLKKFGTDVCGMVGTFSAVALVCAASGVPKSTVAAAADRNRRVSMLMKPPALGCCLCAEKSIPDSMDIQESSSSSGLNVADGDSGLLEG